MSYDTNCFLHNPEEFNTSANETLSKRSYMTKEMIYMSHLSDAQELMSQGRIDDARRLLNNVKCFMSE